MTALFVRSESVEKKCGYNGRWEGQNGTSNEDSPHGWANYTTCLTPEMLRLHGKVYTNAIEGNVSVGGTSGAELKFVNAPCSPENDRHLSLACHLP